MHAILLLLILALGPGAAAPAPAAPAAGPARLVTLAPSVTELADSLGLGPHVVGITDWCRAPAGATPRRVGGILDPTLEAVAALHPDLIVLEAANVEVAASLEALGLGGLRVDHRDLAGILDSLDLLGAACEVPDRARALRAALESRLDALAHRAPPPARRPRVLVVVGRDVGAAGLRDVYAASRGTFLGELLDAAGGANVLRDDAVRYPTLGREALLRLRPDHVLELAPELADDPEGLARLREAWAELGVPSDRLHVFTDPAPTIPGPGCVDTVERFARAIAGGAP